MNYIEWNCAIVRHFFENTAPGSEVFLCVTRETLAEISNTVATEALSDFVRAVREGPEWTKIPGCSRIGSKALNCLYPDPEWNTRRAMVNERKDLRSHCYWKDFHLYNYKYPPYVAYLACFVLGWTERGPDFNGGDYYGPLNEFLGLDDDQRLGTTDFGQAYQLRNSMASTIDLWRDLENWSKIQNIGICHLPTSIINSNRYVEIPKYFGLLKAADLRALPHLFGDLVETGNLELGRFPTPRKIINEIVNSNHATRFLSATCMLALRSAQNDTVLAHAYGRLLCAKFRNFDGFTEDAEDAGVTRKRRCQSLLLRVLTPNGILKTVCRFRRDDPEEMTPIIADKDYCFKHTNCSQAAITRWRHGAWFDVMDFTPPFESMSLTCSELSLTAKLTSANLIVLKQWGLPFHLQGNYVEVEEIEPGRDYFLLAKGTQQPQFSSDNLARLAVRVPQDTSLWKIRVPPEVTADQWPAHLPPLVEERSPQPSICLNGFRIEPRNDIFPLHLPVFIQSPNDALEAFIVDSDIGAEISEKGGVVTLRAQNSGTIVLRLRNKDTQLEIVNTDKNVHFRDVCKMPIYTNLDHLLHATSSAQQYPYAKIHLDGGIKIPVIQEDETIYLESNPPKIIIECEESFRPMLLLRINKNPAQRVAPNPTTIPCIRGVSIYDLECFLDPDLSLHKLRIELRPPPDFFESALSRNAHNPTIVDREIKAIVFSNTSEQYRVTYEVFDNNRPVQNSRGEINTPHNGLIIDADRVKLIPEQLYQLRLQAASTIINRWFTIRRRKNNHPPRQGNGNPMFNMPFENLSLPIRVNGGLP